MARSQQIELKLGQALRVRSHLGKLEIVGSADELEFEHDPKWGVGQMGQFDPWVTFFYEE